MTESGLAYVVIGASSFQHKLFDSGWAFSCSAVYVKVYDTDKEEFGRLSYSVRSDRPKWSMCVECKKHGCKVMVS